MGDPVAREFLLTFWKTHILRHAEEQGVYGRISGRGMAWRGGTEEVT
jgi:hypothetical protein